MSKNVISENENKKNYCKLCGKNFFDKNNNLNFVPCIKMKNGVSICLSCGFAIEEAVASVDFIDDYYDDFYEDIKFEKKEETEKNIVKKYPKRNEVIKKLQSMIIGQDEAIVRVTNMLFRNIKTKNRELKSAPMIIGRSGEGKTEIISQLCKELEIPFVIENAKDFSEAGFTGRNPDEIFTDLYNACGAQISLAEKGVIAFDEIDKLKDYGDSQKDVSGSGVINTLLSYISGTKVPLKDKYGNINGYINTKDITFIFMGAFEDSSNSDSIYEIRENRLDKRITRIGFSDYEEKTGNIEKKEKEIMPEDIIEYGFSRQFAGRMSVVELNKLNEKNYLDILLKSRISVFLAYKKEFESYGVEMVCSEKLPEEIVKRAMKKNTGARGLKSVCDQIFLKPLEEIEILSDEGEVPYKRIIFEDDIYNNINKYHFE